MENLKYWLPVDWYNGGMEHVTRHLIYSSFWHRFLYDIGVVPTKESYAKRTAQVLADERLKLFIDGKEIKNTIIVPGRIANIVV